MIDETDGVRRARRETWAKAIAAACHAGGFTPTTTERRAMNFVVMAVRDAARADGVVIGEETER